ncbi:MAG: dTDP-3-amino-3,6-dideoxy-alpha-D-galactopyranose transaminase [Rhodospirillaceae bacterium]|jgi:dTDP-4-amino-4,6-dideoxygalactose transaminase|nr:MAG: dTDP-3-amino-3,6-dideoxy-alpha-D-galactopyranose transaminase [Rhodospirillaceae bacterium]
MRVFTKPFTQQEAIPDAGIQQAIEILKHGRLHRYNVAAGEASEVSLLEQEYASWQGSRYCIATASGGQAIQLGLRVCGVKPDDKVLANAYTLAPVPGAIHGIGALPVLVEIDTDYHIDLSHLDEMARRSGAKTLLLSHMRGHIADMEALMAIARTYDIKVVEDCAHTMGAKWQGKRSGNFGHVAAFSTQTYKHMNSGEGGFLTTDDDEMAARAIIHSGSYMLYDRHGTLPPDEVFEKIKLEAANFSCRMDNLRATIIRSQMPHLEQNIQRWNRLYDTLFSAFAVIEGIDIPKRRQAEFYVGSSIQFRLNALAPNDIPAFLERCARRGVELKWFGADQPAAFTSRYDSWRYIKELPELPATKAALEKTVDMRIPLTFSTDDCKIIAEIIADEVAPFVTEA